GRWYQYGSPAPDSAGRPSPAQARPTLGPGHRPPPRRRPPRIPRLATGSDDAGDQRGAGPGPLAPADGRAPPPTPGQPAASGQRPRPHWPTSGHTAYAITATLFAPAPLVGTPAAPGHALHHRVCAGTARAARRRDPLDMWCAWGHRQR